MRRLPTAALAVLVAGVAACDADRPTQPRSAESPARRAAASNPTPSTISLAKIGGFDGGGEAAAEITAFNAVSRRLFVVNGVLGTVDVLDMARPSAPRHIATISVAGLGEGANSVASHGNVVAVAIGAVNKTDPGVVAFYRATTLELVSSVTVGALPDMVTFTPDGRHVLVANEGEPASDYGVDPEGSVSIIDVQNVNRPTVRTAGFAAFNGQKAQLRQGGVRIFGPNDGGTVAQNLEPEYVAVGEDGRTAWVTLQENNAIAIVDVERAVVTQLVPLGFKDHALAGNALDASDRDGPGNSALIDIRSWPIRGMYQPDAIAAYTANGQTYLVTANEGDARDWDAFAEEARVKNLTLNPAIFTDAVCGGPCGADSRLGRLNVTSTLGYDVATGQYDALYAFGARSFSIWTASGQQVWDSGDQFEQLTASGLLTGASFNASNDNDDLDDRSDNKGPEPEGVVLGRLGAKTYAFIGLERVGGVMVYDVTDPAGPFFVTYVNTRNGTSGDLGPEGLAFVPARESPSRQPLLIVGNEVSGTTAIFEIRLH